MLVWWSSWFNFTRSLLKRDTVALVILFILERKIEVIACAQTFGKPLSSFSYLWWPKESTVWYRIKWKEDWKNNDCGARTRVLFLFIQRNQGNQTSDHVNGLRREVAKVCLQPPSLPPLLPPSPPSTHLFPTPTRHPYFHPSHWRDWEYSLEQQLKKKEEKKTNSNRQEGWKITNYQ